MDFTTDPVTLSLRNAETGQPLTASVYVVTFDDGTERTMTIAELVMAICLARATEMEDAVIDIMEQMAETTANIEALADIEEKVVERNQNDLVHITGSWTIVTATGETVTASTASAVLSYLGVSIGSTVDSTIDNIETELDSLNTTSQEQMITLQSQTNKRDQSYEMISNTLKSLFTVMSGIVNNV